MVAGGRLSGRDKVVVRSARSSANTRSPSTSSWTSSTPRSPSRPTRSASNQLREEARAGRQWNLASATESGVSTVSLRSTQPLLAVLESMSRTTSFQPCVASQSRRPAPRRSSGSNGLIRDTAMLPGVNSVRDEAYLPGSKPSPARRMPPTSLHAARLAAAPASATSTRTCSGMRATTSLTRAPTFALCRTISVTGIHATPRTTPAPARRASTRFGINPIAAPRTTPSKNVSRELERGTAPAADHGDPGKDRMYAAPAVAPQHTRALPSGACPRGYPQSVPAKPIVHAEAEGVIFIVAHGGQPTSAKGGIGPSRRIGGFVGAEVDVLILALDRPGRV
jgi:hypothetical protein